MRRPLLVITVLAVSLAFLDASSPAIGVLASKADATVTLVTHDSFFVSEDVFGAFRRRTGIRVEVLAAGDAGAVVNQAILTRDHPLGDVLFGVDNTFLSRALREGIFSPYLPRRLDQVPDEYELDPRHRVTPVDHGDVCINYDKAWFAERDLAVPRTLDDLTKPAYRSLLVVENPATSSPGLAFLLATIAELGERGWQDWWRRLRENDVMVVSGWEEAYNGAFTQGEQGGDRPLVVSYASSPPAAVYFSDPQPAESPIGTMLESCFRQIEFVGVLRDAEHPRAAKLLIDFMLSRRFQADIPLSMFVFPVRDGTPLPDVFTRFADVPTMPLSLPARRIGQHRSRWIDRWTDTVLR